MTPFDAIGADGVRRLAHAWHQRVLADEVVGHAFSRGFRDDHVERLAAYWVESLGGPDEYTARYGDESAVVRMHSGNGPHEEMNERAIACFDLAMTDVGIGEAQTVLHEWFVWQTANVNRFERSVDDVPAGLTMPRWGWDGQEN